MLVDDLVVVGAKPLFVTDYIACGRVVPERIAAIVGGVAQACAAAGAALLGGETAEHPGLLEEHEYDLAGATVGVVEKADLLGAERVRDGDRVLALASSGLHANGYSLVRQVIAAAGLSLDTQPPELDRTLGEELLEPTRVYAPRLLAAVAGHEAHAMSHITGGGLANNLARVIPDGLRADIDRKTWTPAPIFTLVQRLGQISQADIEATLNMGVGMALVLPGEAADPVRRALAAAGLPAWVCGEIHPADDPSSKVRLFNRHPGDSV
jgi:phosphoribosylformylglycinamidine cyclo-ligase